MVPDVNEHKGRDTKGLLYYLFGPGKREEHADPHIVASWNPLLVQDPGEFAFRSEPHMERMSALARYLDLPVKALSEPPANGWVWHCPVRNDPGDRLLSDEEWATVARRIMHATNLAREGDQQAVRWVAVRHAEDHIHIVATLARQDGRAPRYHNDAVKAQAECRKMERDFGLRRLNPGDGTAAKRPTTAEIIKAERLAQEQPSRLLLAQAARRALAGARSEEEFLARLEGEGVLVKMSYFPSGDPRGYSLAVLDDTNSGGAPIWYPGAKLAADLSLPKIRSRFHQPQAEQDAPAPVQEPRESGSDTDADTGIERPVAVRRQAAAAVENAVTVIVAEQPEPAAGEISDLAEVLDALAETTTPGQQRAELLAAARAYDRASRSHVRAARSQDRALRRAANDLWHSGYLLRSSKDGGASAWLLAALVLAVFAVANWHAKRGHHQQAAAARESAQHLRRAYQQAAGHHFAALQREGRRLPGPVRQRHRSTVLQYHPHRPRKVDETAFDALAYTLHQAEQQGHDPGELLRQATAWRELDTAQDVTAVLVWRIRHLADLPTPATDAQRPERTERHRDRPQTPDGPGRQR